MTIMSSGNPEESTWNTYAKLQIGAELDWRLEYLTTEAASGSAWLEHIPFAFWIVKTLRPRILVELGTHTGASYMAFCEAIARGSCGGRCFAVDTWKGDEHAGFYDESIFAEVARWNDRYYRSFSTLLRQTFNEAAQYFLSDQIDLLHIDGLHTYEAVAEDFTTWREKLSNRAVVLFHDTNVRERGFGVWRLWQELSHEFPHFEFQHGYGLGVLGLGTDLPDPLHALFTAAQQPNSYAAIGNLFAARGNSIKDLFLLRNAEVRIKGLETEAVLREARAAELECVISSNETHIDVLESAVSACENYIAELKATVSDRESRISELESAPANQNPGTSLIHYPQDQLEQLERQLDSPQDQLERSKSYIAVMEPSKFWKLRSKWLKAKSAFGIKKQDKEETFAQDSHPFQLCIDLAFCVPNVGIFVEGWIIDLKNEILELILVTKHEKVNVESILIKKTRNDLVPYFQNLGVSKPPEDLGFSFLCTLGNITDVNKFLLRVRLRNGKVIDYKRELQQSPGNPLLFIQTILTQNELPNYRMRSILDNDIGPLIRGLWKHRERPKISKTVREYGIQVEQPEVSVIVPLYGRVDFMKYQLALFADDSDLKKNELIYVLDDPRLYDEFLYLCDAQSSIFGIPFKTVYTDTNQGYAGANNSGASIANGRLLLLLNSDVMPIRTGWLSSLVSIYDSLAEVPVGVIGPKLLFGDGSIQHAGIKFFKNDPWGNLWTNEHPRKGQPNFVDPNPRPQKLASVTGACMMVSQELYRHVGGLDEEYIIGDYEDSDFCLKLHAQGFNNYYIPEIELFHLERQTLCLDQNTDDLWRRNCTLYNCWLYNQKWGEYIAQNNL